MKNMKSEKELMDKDINFELISLTQSVHSVRDVQKIWKFRTIWCLATVPL